jgi:hypothetical protein
MTVLAVLAAVVFNALLAQSQLAIDQLAGRFTEAQRSYEQARLEHAQLASPSRIVQRAAALGLVAASSPPTAVVGSAGAGGALGSSSSGSGASGFSQSLDNWSQVKPVLSDGP